MPRMKGEERSKVTGLTQHGSWRDNNALEKFFFHQSTQQVADSSQIKFSCALFSEPEFHHHGQVLTVIFLRIFFKSIYNVVYVTRFKKFRLEIMK
jgi:hypothetical protein